VIESVERGKSTASATTTQGSDSTAKTNLKKRRTRLGLRSRVAWLVPRSSDRSPF
jgi:hypothetical protein